MARTPLRSMAPRGGREATKEARTGVVKASPSVLTEMVQSSARWRQPQESVWQACWDWYRGNTADWGWFFLQDPTQRGRAQNVQVNRIKEIADTIIARTTTRDPKLTLVPRSARAARNADVAESVVNYMWRSREMGHPFKYAQANNVIIGHGWLKVLWHSRIETQTPDREERETAYRAALLERDQFAERNPTQAEQLPSDRDVRANVDAEFDSMPPRLISHEEYPLTRSISPWDMYVDQNAQTFEEADWVAERVWMHKDEVLANDGYSRAARKEVRDGLGNVTDKTTESAIDVANRDRRGESWREESGGGHAAPHTHLVEVVEFHDLRRGTWCQFVPDAENFLLPPTDSPYKHTPLKSPYEMLTNYQTPDFYPLGDVELLIPLNWEENETRTLLMAHRRQLATKVVMRSQDMTAEVQQQMQAAAPGTIVTVEGTNRPLQDIVHALPPSVANPQLFDLANRSYADIKALSGVSDMQLGVGDASRRSATEAAGLLEAGTTRMQLHVERSQKIAARIGARVLLLCQLYLTQEMVVRIVGDDGVSQWHVADRQQILGQYDYEVQHGSMMPKNDATKRQDTLALLQSLGMLSNLANGPFHIAALAQLVLRQFGVENADDYVISPQDQQAVQAQQQAAGQAAFGGGVGGGISRPTPSSPGA